MREPTLLTPRDVGPLTLPNRVVMAPLTRCRADNADHAPTELHATYYAQRASAGLIISEGAPISPTARGYVHTPGIYSRNQIQAWKRTTEAVHHFGGRIFCQLWHVGRMSHAQLIGRPPLAPSAINADDRVYTSDGFVPTSTPVAMTGDEIRGVVGDFERAAMNALEAGFDGVEIHASNGYLLHQFFANCANRRQDDYGGSIENRARILFDILDRLATRGILERCGVRLNPSYHGLFGIRVDPQTIPTFEFIVRRLNRYGLAYLHLSEPFTDVTDVPDAVTEIAKHFRPLYHGTLIINGGFTRSSAEQVLASGDADLVAFGRPYIANPDLVERFTAQAPLAEADPECYFAGGPRGYIDYPKWPVETTKMG